LTVLEGRFGFLETFLGSARIDVDGLLQKLGHRPYSVTQLIEKRYPGTALNQLPVELMRRLIQQHGLKTQDIAEIRLELPSERQNFASGHYTGPFTRRVHAMGSCVFQLGMLLLDGDLRMDRFDDVSNPIINAVTKQTRVQFVHGKPIRYARMLVRTTAGKEYEAQGDEFRFEREDPRSIMEREARGVLPSEKIERFLQVLADLERVDYAAELMASLVP